jgi:hypothetical protein
VGFDGVVGRVVGGGAEVLRGVREVLPNVIRTVGEVTGRLCGLGELVGDLGAG